MIPVGSVVVIVSGSILIAMREKNRFCFFLCFGHRSREQQQRNSHFWIIDVVQFDDIVAILCKFEFGQNFAVFAEEQHLRRRKGHLMIFSEHAHIQPVYSFTG